MKEVSIKNFAQEVKQSEIPVLVDFYADWCGPCQMLSPIIHEIAEAYQGKLKVVKANVDHAPELAMEFGVASIPTLLFFQEGSVQGTSVGFIDKNGMEQKLQAWGYPDGI